MTRQSPRVSIRSQMIALTAGLACLTAAPGCGSRTEVAQAKSESAKTSPAGQTATATPEDVVSQFLDRVRRGGEASAAGELLTRKAQAELARIGRTVQPIGSPDASFQVTRSQAVPEEPDSVLVHSLWMEPGPEGTASETQVVWAVERDPVQWRISGLAMELVPGQSPEIIDFENGELMARLLAANETAEESNTANASTADSTGAESRQEAARAAAPEAGLTR